MLHAIVCSLVFALTYGLELDEYVGCCHYCRGDQDLWMEVAPEWKLSIQDEQVTGFQDPPAYLVDHEISSSTELYNRVYQLKYAGAPIMIAYQGMSDPNGILTQQYVQLDLGFNKDVAGVAVQGGFYEELDNDLVERETFTITQFAVSTSTSGASFLWMRDNTGSVTRFNGPSSYDEQVLAGFHGETVTARYVRVHPLGGQDKNGVTTQEVMMRVSIIYCTLDICVNSQSHCVLREWQAWGSCDCDWAGCVHSRERIVARYQSCGGSPCEATMETKTCVPPEPLWKSIVLYVGIGLIVLILLIIISWVLYKKQKKAQPEFVFKKDEKKKKKDKKSRKVRPDIAGNGKLEEEKMDEEAGGDDDFAEKELSGDKGEKKEMSEMERATVVEADEQPVVNSKNKPVKPLKSKKKKQKEKEKEKEKEMNKSQMDMDKLMKELDTPNETEIDGLYMVKRDETVAAAPQPAKPKPVGAALAPLAPLGGPPPPPKKRDSIGDLMDGMGDVDEW